MYGIALPKNSSKTEVILLYTRVFDTKLWAMIRSELSKKNINVKGVTAITGEYYARGTDVFLNLSSATLRKTQREIKLAAQIRASI